MSTRTALVHYSHFWIFRWANNVQFGPSVGFSVARRTLLRQQRDDQIQRTPTACCASTFTQICHIATENRLKCWKFELKFETKYWPVNRSLDVQVSCAVTETTKRRERSRFHNFGCIRFERRFNVVHNLIWWLTRWTSANIYRIVIKSWTQAMGESKRLFVEQTTLENGYWDAGGNLVNAIWTCCLFMNRKHSIEKETDFLVAMWMHAKVLRWFVPQQKNIQVEVKYMNSFPWSELLKTNTLPLHWIRRCYEFLVHHFMGSIEYIFHAFM